MNEGIDPQLRWRFPPPAVPRRWLSWAIGAGVMFAVIASSLTAAVFIATASGTPGYIDDESVLAVVENSCDRLHEEIESIDVPETPRGQLQRIALENRALQKMVDTLGRIDPQTAAADPPTQAWVGDWQSLLSLRQALLTELRDGGRTTINLPRDDDGNLVIDRMDAAAAAAGCTVPGELVDHSGTDLTTI